MHDESLPKHLFIVFNFSQQPFCYLFIFFLSILFFIFYIFFILILRNVWTKCSLLRIYYCRSSIPLVTAIAWENFIFMLTFWYININWCRLCVWCTTRIISWIGNLRLLYDQSTLRSWAWNCLDRDISSIVIVVHHSIISLPIHKLRRTRRLQK